MAYRTINDSMMKVTDPSISIFIEPGRYGVKNNNGDIILMKKGNTIDLKSNYTYTVCANKKTREMHLLVEPDVNMPFYIPLDKMGD